MQISRRNLLGGLGTIGAGLWIPLVSSPARTADCAELPFVITVHAGGGWDPTFFCDPIVDNPKFSVFSSADVLSEGPLSYLPMQSGAEAGGSPVPYLVGEDDFWKKHFERAIVINGVDTQTVSHDVGNRYSSTGSVREGYPNLSALVAGLSGAELPLAFVTSGTGRTAGLVVSSRASGALNQVWDPNNGGKYLLPETHGIVQAARWQADIERSLQPASALRARNVDMLQVARNAGVDEQFVAFASRLSEFKPEESNDLADAAAVALAGMSEGLCVAAHLTAEGAAFDTHSEHDRLQSYSRGHRVSLNKTFQGLDYILERAAADSRIAARGLVVHVASEFGRTTYNDTGGKDHWPITSNLVFAVGSAAERFSLGRVVGGTIEPSSDEVEGVVARRYAPGGDKMTEVEIDDPQGRTLNSTDVHIALRNALGLCDDHLSVPILKRLALAEPEGGPLPIF